MVQIKYERYWDDYHRKNEEKSFQDLTELENWIFDQMKQDYTKERFAMSFPTPEIAKRINEAGPWSIEFKPDRYGETFWIRQISDERGIIFSDGTFTAGLRHWSEDIKDWLQHCEIRRRSPQFDFVD